MVAVRCDTRRMLSIPSNDGDNNSSSPKCFPAFQYFYDLLRLATPEFAHERDRCLFADVAICLYLFMSKDKDTPRRTMMFATKKAIRRAELRQIVPLSDSTIYDLEQRGEFPRRFYLTARCVVWDLTEIEEWIHQRRRASESSLTQRAPLPDVRQRKARPVRQ